MVRGLFVGRIKVIPLVKSAAMKMSLNQFAEVVLEKEVSK